ncbi:MAG: hypothetical protein ACQER1_09795 [Armatimonadota bacterium]
MRTSLLVITVMCAIRPPLVAQPLVEATAGHWRSDRASMAAGGTLAPMAILGEVRPDAPTTLPLSPCGEVAFEAGSTVPFAYVQGNRYFVDLHIDRREARLAAPISGEVDEAHWWLGFSLTSTDARVYHRDRWLDDRAHGHGTGSILALAWRDGGWTLGAARRDADLSGLATGDNLADILGVRRGHERLEFGWDGRADSLGAQYETARWLAGVQMSERDDRARLATEVSGTPFTGTFATDTRTIEAWVAHGPTRERQFAYFVRSDVDPAPGAIASGHAIRGRAALSAESTVFGVGRRRTGARATEHFELTWIMHSLDLSGRVSDGALGSLDGQISVEASADARTIGARWGRALTRGRWRYTLAASVMHTDLDFHARAVDSPGPFLAPNWRWEERLKGGGGLVGSITLGVGREIDGWELGASYSLFGGDTWGEFEDLTEPAWMTTRRRIPPAPDTGPSPTLDLGWTFSLEIGREL